MTYCSLTLTKSLTRGSRPPHSRTSARVSASSAHLNIVMELCVCNKGEPRGCVYMCRRTSLNLQLFVFLAQIGDKEWNHAMCADQVSGCTTSETQTNNAFSLSYTHIHTSLCTYLYTGSDAHSSSTPTTGMSRSTFSDVSSLASSSTAPALRMYSLFLGDREEAHSAVAEQRASSSLLSSTKIKTK